MRTTTEEAPSLLNRPELAKELGFSVRYIQMLEKRHLVPFYRFGHRCIRYNLTEVMAALKQCRVGSKFEGKGGR
jgi:hypothetical protein